MLTRPQALDAAPGEAIEQIEDRVLRVLDLFVERGTELLGVDARLIEHAEQEILVWVDRVVVVVVDDVFERADEATGRTLDRDRPVGVVFELVDTRDLNQIAVFQLKPRARAEDRAVNDPLRARVAYAATALRIGFIAARAQLGLGGTADDERQRIGFARVT